MKALNLPDISPWTFSEGSSPSLPLTDSTVYEHYSSNKKMRKSEKRSPRGDDTSNGKSQQRPPSVSAKKSTASVMSGESNRDTGAQNEDTRPPRSGNSTSNPNSNLSSEKSTGGGNLKSGSNEAADSQQQKDAIAQQTEKIRCCVYCFNMGNNADVYFDDLLLPGKEMNLGLSKLAKNKDLVFYVFVETKSQLTKWVKSVAKTFQKVLLPFDSYDRLFV